ncbi:hypothetical protein V8F33_004984 [Rhypophila sp. PSN 637]
MTTDNTPTPYATCTEHSLDCDNVTARLELTVPSGPSRFKASGVSRKQDTVYSDNTVSKVTLPATEHSLKEGGGPCDHNSLVFIGTLNRKKAIVVIHLGPRCGSRGMFIGIALTSGKTIDPYSLASDRVPVRSSGPGRALPRLRCQFAVHRLEPSIYRYVTLVLVNVVADAPALNVLAKKREEKSRISTLTIPDFSHLITWFLDDPRQSVLFYATLAPTHLGSDFSFINRRPRAAFSLASLVVACPEHKRANGKDSPDTLNAQVPCNCPTTSNHRSRWDLALPNITERSNPRAIDHTFHIMRQFESRGQDKGEEGNGDLEASTDTAHAPQPCHFAARLRRQLYAAILTLFLLRLLES